MFLPIHSSDLLADSPAFTESYDERLIRGQVLHRTLQTNRQQRYYLYLPHCMTLETKIFVTIHGISRNAREHAKKFSALAEAYNTVLIAPFFPSDRFPDYQRLGRTGQRADYALNEILLEVAELTGLATESFYLFGYSGGAQFAHRYLFAYPNRVRKLALGAPGWYTYPDPSVNYPRGLKNIQRLQLTADPTAYLRIPVCVLVGERDNQRDDELNQSPKIDCLQGKTRIERGQNWIKEMMLQAKVQGLDTLYSFRLLPNSPHSFSISMRRGNMGKQVFSFLFSDIPNDKRFSQASLHMKNSVNPTN